MFEREPEKPHFARIAVIMLGVLLLSTGAAWLLVAGRDRASVRGAEIVRELRGRGLGAFWDGPQIRWYLETRQGRPVGWHAFIVAPAGQEYHGLDVRHWLTPTGEQTYWERWELNATATAGAYRAGPVARGMRITDTVIRYAKDEVSLLKNATDAKALSPAPDNYIPEGALNLVCLLTSRQDRRAYFHMVFNEREPVAGKIDYGTIMLQPVDAASLGISEAVSAVRYRTWVPRQQDRVLAFDRQGRLLATVSADEDGRRTAVAESEVLRHFPDAADLVVQLARSLKLPANPQAPESEQPDEPQTDELTMRRVPPNDRP